MREITVRECARFAPVHIRKLARTPPLNQVCILWVEVAEEIVLIDKGGAEHCPSLRRKPQQLQ